MVNFGFSREFTEEKLSTFCGTISYMTPEILQLKSYGGPKIAIWSMEVALYRMVTGELPFVGEIFEEVRKILSEHFFIPYFLSLECQRLLQNLITLNFSQRSTMKDIMKDHLVHIG